MRGGEFKPVVEAFKKTMTELTGKAEPLKDADVLLDTNYFSEENLQIAQEQKINVLIPDPHFRSRDERFVGRAGEGKRKRKFGVEDFAYNEAENSYTCPQGKKLIYRGKAELSHNRCARRYTTKVGECIGGPVIDECINRRAGKEPRRTLYLTEDNEAWLSEGMRKKIDQPENRQKYSHRMELIEPCFADIEYCKGMARFTLRGRKKVNGQWKLYCVAHNIGKCVKAYRERRVS